MYSIRPTSQALATFMVVLMSSLSIGPVVADDDQDIAVPADQAMNCLRAATKARPGNVRELKVERENGRKICTVEIYTRNREYDVKVNLANYRILSVDED